MDRCAPCAVYRSELVEEIGVEGNDTAVVCSEVDKLFVHVICVECSDSQRAQHDP